MKILVMGTGGIGGYYGGRLAEAGADIFFVARGAHLDAIKKNGLKVTSVAGDFHLKNLKISSDPKDAGFIDIVILGTKTWDIEEAVSSLKPILKAESILIHFQNGIDIRNRISKIIPIAQIIGGLEYGVVQILEPGHIGHSTHIHHLAYGAFQNPVPKLLSEFHQACLRSKFDNYLVDDIEVKLWCKFLFICAYSGVTSLLRLPIGKIMNDPEASRTFEECMREIFEVAKVKNILIPQGFIGERLAFCRDSLEPGSTSSMQRDLEAGRRLELESLNGALSRISKSLNVATPINDFIYKSLKPFSLGTTSIS